MTKKEFLHGISESREDILGRFFGLLEDLAGLPPPALKKKLDV